MALTEERYKAEIRNLKKNNRKAKNVEKELQKELEKLRGLSLDDFQKGIVSALWSAFSMGFEIRNDLNMLGIELGKSFGTCEELFKEVAEDINEIQDDIAHLKMSALKNSLIAEEKLFLGRPLTMKERRRIFSSVKIDYDGFAAAAKNAKKEALKKT